MSTKSNVSTTWIRPASQFFRAVGNETGLLICLLLALNKELTTEEIAKLLGKPTLKIAALHARLMRFNIITRRRRGRIMYYSLASEQARTVLLATKEAFT